MAFKKLKYVGIEFSHVKIIVAAATLSILPSTLAAPATINPANELKRQSLNVRLVCNNATWRYTHGADGEEESAEIRKVGGSFCSGESRLIPSYRICAKRRTCTFNQSDQLRRM
ncbi:hypothetical protein DL95DRAFT_403997 [Leptodontidium sp. 2 PMI_412]|nr:hypothetical protein DL95DRAFT_403997 [Leptodontidium sp. 2 PMI_412]